MFGCMELYSGRSHTGNAASRPEVGVTVWHATHYFPFNSALQLEPSWVHDPFFDCKPLMCDSSMEFGVTLCNVSHGRQSLVARTTILCIHCK